MQDMPADWPDASYQNWSATCDTLHAHTQVLGKLAARLAPPEPQLQHAALRLTARGWETAPLPAPNGSGSLVIALDLRTHEAIAEHSGGHDVRIPLTPDRPVADVTRDVLAAVRGLAGPVEISPVPQEVPWSVPLDEDREHASYDQAQVSAYFGCRDQGSGRAGRVPRAVPREVHAGQRVVGLVRPGREPVLRPAGESARRRLHHAQRHGLPGGRGRLVARRPASSAGRVLRLRAPGSGRLRGSDPLARPRRTGMPRSASTCCPGTTCGPPPTRTRSHSSSPGRLSGTPARCARGIPAWPPAPTASRRPFADLPGAGWAAGPATQGTRPPRRRPSGRRGGRGAGSPG